MYGVNPYTKAADHAFGKFGGTRLENRASESLSSRFEEEVFILI